MEIKEQNTSLMLLETKPLWYVLLLVIFPIAFGLLDAIQVQTKHDGTLLGPITLIVIGILVSPLFRKYRLTLNKSNNVIAIKRISILPYTKKRSLSDITELDIKFTTGFRGPGKCKVRFRSKSKGIRFSYNTWNLNDNKKCLCQSITISQCTS